MGEAEDSKRRNSQDGPPSSCEPEVIQERSSKSGGSVVRRYKKGQFLGKGGFARCYQIENMENKKISAIKIVCKETLKKSKAKQKLITQIKIHKALSHKNIVGFDHVFENSENVYIVLELCSNHTLNEMIKKRKRISELEVQYFLGQIIEGLKYAHANRVIHRDLKLGNLMLNEEMQIKIGDFGLAAKLEFNTEKRKTICGTPNYLAPEIIDGKGHSYEVDIWSMGVIMYTLLFGRPPFETNDVKKTYKRIKECLYTFNDEVNVSHNAKNLISRILVLDPSKRLTLDQILSHPFMTSNKVPKTMPNSCLSAPLPRSFVEQYTFYTGNLGSAGKLHNSMKTLERVEGQYDKLKNQSNPHAVSQKGISERLLLRTSSGFNRNNFISVNKNSQSKVKDELQQNGGNLLLQNAYGNNFSQKAMSNNFFISNSSVKPQSSSGMRASSSMNKNRVSVNKPEKQYVYVKKWVDYSTKYGLGYLLSNGATGICFNDSTKMCSDAQLQKIDYVTNEADESKALISFNASDSHSDREISKKITLMQYFRKYLTGNSANQGVNEISEYDRQSENQAPFFYIKKWVKTELGILFRLNNRVIQVNFNDKSQIMIYADSQTVVYSAQSSTGLANKVVFSLEDLSASKKNHEFSSKFEHVKLMLRKITKQKSQEILSTEASNFGAQFDVNGKEMIKNY